MKFYKVLCQFAKIHTLFTESLEKGLDKVVSRGEKNFSVHRKYMNFLRPRKTALDEPLYKLSAGRSMVEMLGVLAIIGVLSVGAIAGYSKAMMKYKLNKQAESMNMLFVNSFQLMPKINNTSTNGNPLFLSETMYRLGLLPDGISFVPSNPDYLKDQFKNDIWIYAYPAHFGIGYSFIGDNNGKEICRNLFNVYKQHADILRNVSTDQRIIEEDKKEYQDMAIFYGNQYCDSSNKCISNMSLNDIDSLCNACLKSSEKCRLFVSWYK